jgi:hypothetical protein
LRLATIMIGGALALALATPAFAAGPAAKSDSTFITNRTMKSLVSSLNEQAVPNYERDILE